MGFWRNRIRADPFYLPLFRSIHVITQAFITSGEFAARPCPRAFYLAVSPFQTFIEYEGERFVNKHLGLIIGTFFAAVLLFGLTTPSNGFAVTCASLGGSISGKTVLGSLSVTSDCTVQNSIIAGGIDQTGGSLVVCDSLIGGSVMSTGGTSSAIFGESNGAIGNCPGDTINGGVSVSGVSVVEFDRDLINGGAQIDNNTTAEVEGTFINGGLSCMGNTDIFNDEGGLNTVNGAKTGQCVGGLPH
jgi:hypothetical protein